MTGSLEQSAVVIGASGGVGAAVVRRLAASGRYVVVHAVPRSGAGLDLEEEASIAEAAALAAVDPTRC